MAAPDDARFDELREWAHSVAALGEAAPGPGLKPWLLADLKAQEALLQSTVVALRTGNGGQEALSHGAEWMLDNFYLAQQSLRQIREDMPRGFYRQLPKLAAGPLQGYPRIYDLAQQLVASSDARLDLEQVQRFIWLYQDVQLLTTGELWALPVMLRLSVLTVLTQAAGQISTRLGCTGRSPPHETWAANTAPRGFPHRRRGRCQLLHQPARHCHLRLDGLLRACQPGRADLAQRPARRVRRAWTAPRAIGIAR